MVRIQREIDKLPDPPEDPSPPGEPAEAGGGTPTDEGEPTPESGPAPDASGGTVGKPVWPGTEQDYQAYLGKIKVEIDESLGKARVQIARALDSAFIDMAPLTDQIAADGEISPELGRAMRDVLIAMAQRDLDPETAAAPDAAANESFIDLVLQSTPGGAMSGVPLTAEERTDAAIALLEGGPPDEATLAASPGPNGLGLGLGLDVGVKHMMRWNPSYSLGLETETGGPLHDFDNKIETSSLELDLWVRPTGGRVFADAAGTAIPPGFMDAGLERFGASFNAGQSEDTDEKPDGNGPGQIFSIDGLNTQNLTATRNTRLETKFSFFDLAPYLIFKLPGGSRTNFLKALVALYYANQVFEYNFREEISGGGAFFDHTVNSRLENEVFGAKAGLDWSFELAPGWRAEVGGQIMTGYQNARLEALQEGTNFGTGPVSVTATSKGLAYQVGGGLGLERVFGNGMSVRVRGDGSFMGGIPILSHPTASRRALTIDRGTGAEMVIIVRAVLPLN